MVDVNVHTVSTTWRDHCARTSVNAIAFPCIMEENHKHKPIKYGLATCFCGCIGAYCMAAEYWRKHKDITPGSNMCVTGCCAPAVMTMLNAKPQPLPQPQPPTRLEMTERRPQTLRV